MTNKLLHWNHKIGNLLYNQYPKSMKDHDVRVFYYRIETILSYQLSCAEHSEASYTNIPARNDKFIDLLDALPEPTMNLKFLDVGCGFGLKCWLARQKGYQATGIDICQKYIDFAKLILEDISIDLECCDAFEYKNYKDFDVIYIYQPIKDENKFTELVDIIAKQMKKSAYLLMFCSTVDARKFSKLFQPISKNGQIVGIWQKL